MSIVDPHATLLKLLGQATHAFERELNRELQAALRDDLRPAHYAVFRYLAPEGSRISAMAQEAGMTQQSMGELVAHMERCGYVERKVDPSDRRARLVVVTREGQAALGVAAERITRIERTLMASLGERGLDELRESLGRVREALSEEG
ncbi:MarR family winged helix-turn-helix transcriptional regulator [Nocardia sp. CA-107356]|uniref:MarR family winged helix-turn-helix transcriptional regulator n=1 Tax=Nocardia sp. CA-107356 TaxID=3239972 RepID=UPI003D90A6D9